MIWYYYIRIWYYCFKPLTIIICKLQWIRSMLADRSMSSSSLLHLDVFSVGPFLCLHLHSEWSTWVRYSIISQSQSLDPLFEIKSYPTNEPCMHRGRHQIIASNNNFPTHLTMIASIVVKCDHSAHSLASHGNYSWFTARAISSLRIVNKNCMSIFLLLLPKVSNEWNESRGIFREHHCDLN